MRPIVIRLFRSPVFFILLSLLLIGWGLTRWLDERDLQNFRESYGLASVAITLPAHIVIAITPFPSDVIAIANGMLYGIQLGTLLSWVGWWIAAILEFGLGQRASRDLDLDSQRDHLPAWLSHFPVGHPAYLIGVRQIPWLGMHVSSFVPGVAGVTWRRFLWCSAIGAIPGSLLMTAIGAGIVQFS
ncbi:Uncharacterized membrane protein YdjX, TVP38/TMEM64 family, SNARE-associated domain [Neorhodopirellula lusitana]|uniref:TVP38/TMEM64 family membrane protein n=1 Tax=Neorhodopirellula lusitana TaxID=445327 RepID=A0ABY1PV42_9BACT|nr:VTT domain-containing protein [Neorhodopirellula lusitana]SMP46587.1 Uncharacterized membrane protein YdjX, TVP38/TMEM64 family, SNARE-associated domain [Neorhodopirellula lusitana]